MAEKKLTYGNVKKTAAAAIHDMAKSPTMKLFYDDPNNSYNLKRIQELATECRSVDADRMESNLVLIINLAALTLENMKQ